jgi:histidine ammonia-lyase
MNELKLDGEHLTIEDVVRIAYEEPGATRVVLASEARERVVRSARAVQQMLDEGRIVYGITTGFGAFKDRVIPRAQVELLQRNILVSHAVGVGSPFDRATTRAIILIRANTLARGFSGIRPETLELLLALLNQGLHPVIPEKGSLSASGDLAPLAHMSLPLIGEGSVEMGGEVLPSAEAFRRAGLSPIVLAAKEGWR